MWIAIVLLALAVGWWIAATPRREIGRFVRESITFDEATANAIRAVDQSAEFAAELEDLASTVPPYDDAVILDGGKMALVTAHDGKIWKLDLATHAAEPFADSPHMAWGIHEVPGDANHVYVCVSGSYGERASRGNAGIYRLSLDTRQFEPLVVRVPDTRIDHAHPVVYADGDPRAPELQPNEGGRESGRAIVTCDNLEVSEDGRRLYFSEPFAYENATVGDALDEALALAGNGRLWRHDLDSGTTRLIAEGFHFINGILYDPHPGRPTEESLIVSQTSLFRLTRFYLNGPQAGTSEVVLDGLTGTPDGIDRDEAGRIWVALFLERTKLLTWVHANAWIKPLLMRLPSRLLLSQQGRTGVLVLDPSGSQPLYTAFFKGAALSSVSSAVPSPAGIYIANVSLVGADRQPKGVQRLRWPFNGSDER